MAWTVLIVAGLFEAVWAIALDASHNFRLWRPTLVFAASLAVSLIGLAIAMKTLPTGTAYAVWVGIGATATVVYAIATRKEAASVGRVLMLVLLVGSVVGLKAVS